MSSRPWLNFVRLLSLCLLLLTFVASPGMAADTDAQCSVVFDAVWSSATHPIDFPASAHFSGLVGGTHNDQVSFWQPGGFATPGIRSMAETGSKTLLLNEVQNAINGGTAESSISGGGIASPPDSVSVDFTATLQYPLATVVTMIAPSPDWFVGVHGEQLFNNGHWSDLTVVSLPPYDAGTDSGATFTSPNDPTTPAEQISQIAVNPFPNSTSLGTFSIVCESDLLYYDGFESGDFSGWSGSVGVSSFASQALD